MSREYAPDGWVVIKVSYESGDSLYKILGTWSGGYMTGDCWRLSSGTDQVGGIRDVSEGVIEWPQASGSKYVLKLSGENRLNAIGLGTLSSLEKHAKESKSVAMEVVEMSSLR